VLLFILLYPILRQPLNILNKENSIQSYWKSFFGDYLQENVNRPDTIRQLYTFYYSAIFILATCCLLFYFFQFGTATSSIFTDWDAVVSWDRWAIEWSTNRLPTITWHYPQLIPANWSLTYQFMGNSQVKFFAKNYAGYIEIFVILSIFILGLKKRKIGYFWSVIIAGWLQYVFGSRGNGYVDSSVAFLGLLSIMCLVMMQENLERKKIILLGAIFAAGSALTKQAGMWVVLVYPVLVALLGKPFRKGELWKLLLIIGLIDILLVAPWNVYKQIQIDRQLEPSEIEYVTTLASKGRSTFEVMTLAFSKFTIRLSENEKNRYVFVILLVILLFAGLSSRFWRKIFLLVVFPYTGVWIFLFSYDTRNLTLIIPIIGILAGLGLAEIIEAIPNHVSSGKKVMKRVSLMIAVLGRPPVMIYLFAFLILLFLLPTKYSDSYMIKKSVALQKTIGTVEVNNFLYDYYLTNGLDGKILTDYQYLGSLPELSSYYVLGYSDTDNFLSQFIEPEIGYALIDNRLASSKVLLYINSLLDSGKIIKLFSYEDFSFVTTCHGICY